MKTLTIMLSIASVIVIIGMLLGLYRGIKGPDGASRVAVNDLIFLRHVERGGVHWDPQQFLHPVRHAHDRWPFRGSLHYCLVTCYQ